MNNVSFGIQSSTFSDMVNRPQAYKNPKPASAPAATGVAGDTFAASKPKKKHTLLKLAAGAAAVCGLLVAGNKTGISNKIPKVGTYLETAGKVIEEKAVKIYETIKDKLPKKAAEGGV